MKYSQFLAVLLSLAPLLALGKPYPLDYWARRDVISAVTVSPDGQRLGLMKIPAKGENPIIEIYETANLGKKPFRINAKPMEIEFFDWVDNDNIVMRSRQKVRDKIDDFNEGVYGYRLALVDIKKRKIKEFKEEETSTVIVSVLPDKPRKILISLREGAEDGPGAKLQEAFRPRSYWEFDLDRGSKKLLIRGKLLLANIDFDDAGNPILARGFDLGSSELILFWRRPGENKWTEFYRQHEDEFETFEVYGKDPVKPGHFIVEATRGGDKSSLWSFSAEKKSFAEQLYKRSDVDICGVIPHSNTWTHNREIVGVWYCKDKIYPEFFDEAEGALHRQLHQVIPGADYIDITSRSRDGNTLTIRNTGPRDPGTYYLLYQGKLQLIGGARPYFEPEQLADVRYITYPARDGRIIPAYLTVPNGKPPFPLVVMPHGGPFVRETVLFSEWGQLLANNGYLVLQPQYRGSRNYGMDHYQSAFIKGGQGGYKMQDDKDDGVAHLLKEGLTTRDNVAMFGWSYGGYAALVAASRSPQAYRCTIAGAAVSDPNMQVNYYRYQMRGTQKIAQLNMWDDSVSPMEEVAKVNVPVLLIHGDVDQRVPVGHAKKYLKALRKADKPHKYVELKGADHFSNTLFYDHKMTIYKELLGYLSGECGLRAG